jgi:hypothetical protein
MTRKKKKKKGSKSLMTGVTNVIIKAESSVSNS